MKAGKEEPTWLLGVAGSVKVSMHVLMKGKKGESLAPEPAIKGKRSCLLDGEKRSVHRKAKGDSWEIKKVKGGSAKFNLTLTLLNTPWRERKYSWRMESSGGGLQHIM